MTYIREDEALITLSIKGTPFPAAGVSWATYDGGELSATTSKTRPGGMGSEVDVGGPPTRGDITITTQFTDAIAAVHNQIEALVGHGPAQVAITYLGPDRGTVAGFVHSGTVKSCTLPKGDAGGSAVSFYTVVVACDELAVLI